MLNGTYTQDEVNEKTAILKQRISGLRADKTALQEKYDKIKDMTQGQATDESWKEFTGLREQAKNVLDNPNATPNEVSEILEKLNKRIRIRALREIPNNRELLIHLTKRRV